MGRKPSPSKHGSSSRARKSARWEGKEGRKDSVDVWSSASWKEERWKNSQERGEGGRRRSREASATVWAERQKTWPVARARKRLRTEELQDLNGR